MAPVYADHPFPLIPSPIFQNMKASKDYKPDMFDSCASEMACVHNMIVRGLNSIYLQAPHIQPKDQASFAQYMLYWCKLLECHHSGEEESFFPEVEAMAGEKGIMEGNVQQHEAFHDGLEEFQAYVEACVAGKQSYDGSKVVGMIDGFGATLSEHLADEIPSLVNLRKYGLEKMAGLPKIFDEEGQKNMKSLGLIRGMPLCGANHDITFEGGLWANFPPAPWFILFFVRHISWWVHADWWKFGSCDRFGQPIPLYAVPEQKSEQKAE